MLQNVHTNERVYNEINNHENTEEKIMIIIILIRGVWEQQAIWIINHSNIYGYLPCVCIYRMYI